MHHPLVWPALLATVALAGCQQPAPATPPAPAAAAPAAAAYEAPRMTPEEARAAVARGDAIVFVDVRFKENYALERIAGAMSAPWGELATAHALLPKEKLLLLYCT